MLLTLKQWCTTQPAFKQHPHCSVACRDDEASEFGDGGDFGALPAYPTRPNQRRLSGDPDGFNRGNRRRFDDSDRGNEGGLKRSRLGSYDPRDEDDDGDEYGQTSPGRRLPGSFSPPRRQSRTIKQEDDRSSDSSLPLVPRKKADMCMVSPQLILIEALLTSGR